MQQSESNITGFSFSSMTLIVTSGPTREWLDPVRFLTNASSGKTGFEIASAGVKRFQKVIYIAGQCEERYRSVNDAMVIHVDTTADMAKAVQSSLCENSLLIMAAAPADFTPATPADQKIKKQPNETTKTIELKPTIDILKFVGQNPPLKSIRVGFAAETENLKQNALKKLQSKNIHFICANQVFKTKDGFGEVQNTLHLLDQKGGETLIGPFTKDKLAKALLDELENRLR